MTKSARRGLARARQHAGRVAEAERLYGEVLKRDPDNPESWHLLGRLAQQRGDGNAAAARVLQAIRKQPGNPAFPCSLGDILAAQGKVREAALCYHEALRLDPGWLAALVNLGNVLQRQGRYQDACISYWRAIERDPQCTEAYNNLGNALRAEGRAEEALECYRQALRLEPDNADAAVNLAGALVQVQRPAEAEPWARRALELRPGSVAALSNLSAALTARRRFAEAEAPAREAVARAPLAAHLHSNLGSVLLHQKRFAEAEAELGRALEIDPDSPETRNALAIALKDQGRLEEAAAQGQAVVRARPGYAEGWATLGTVRQGQGRNLEALACLDEAVRIQPDHGKARFARSLSLLMAGRLPEGFAEYEWRWRMLAEKPRACVRPVWDGGPLDGKTILLSAEQGLGDAIQFARYAPLVAARGGRVVVEAAERLAPLLRTIEGVADVITPAMPLPPFDEQAPLMSLPHILGSNVETIPGNTPYMYADERLTARMRAALGAAGGLRVGLAWAGNPEHLGDRYRSLALETLAPFRELAGVEWYSLHIGEKARAEVRQGGWVREILGESGGVAELAALMCGLDLVISVDSMPAHLAGALGRPVWTLLCLAADWRWQLERENTPWYPTMRLFRQSRPGDWDGAVARVCQAVREGAIQGSAERADKHS
jgi:tetratricopeptide (TPR) repeat protein